jgi:pimeloyl-ACP methyl ester carboxylesterase
VKNLDDRTLELPDGRFLGFVEYGTPAGKPLLYFHGHPGARLEARFLADAASRVNVRLIGIDWPNDIAALAHSLGLDRFAVVGFSGGGPYALACAHAIPDRLVSCGVVSGVGRTGFVRSFLAAWLPWLMLPLARRRCFPNQEQAEETLTRFSDRWPEPDRVALEIPGVKELMAASLVEGLTQGARGAAYDGALLGRAWGFEPEQLDFPAVYLWHGELDSQVPITDLRALAQRIRQAKPVFYPEDAHISTIVNHGGEIIESLLG